MLYKFSCKNFHSIKESIEVKFGVNQHAPLSDVYADTEHGRIALIQSVIGPNASGKTNILKALTFLRHTIVNTPESDDPIPFYAFAGENSNQITEISADFSVDSRYISYQIKFDAERILEEGIKEVSNSTNRCTTKTLYHRSWVPTDKEDYKPRGRGIILPSGMRVRHNASVVSSMKLTGNNQHIASKIFDYWHNSVISNVTDEGNINASGLVGDHFVKKTIEQFHDNSNLKEAIIEKLRRLDFGFHAFDNQSDIQGGKQYKIVHNFTNDTKFTLPLKYESSGTKEAIILLNYLLHALSQPGGIAVIDELDAYLHADIVEDLVGLFMSIDTNPNRSQLLFSSHSHQLLSQLDKQLITLVEKREDGSTDVWRLDDVTGVRTDDNYYAKYIAGSYAAKPRIG